MSVIPKEQILRLNCPGYGEESYLALGRARALDTYSVIIVNPVSILHLFDKDPESIRDIDTKLNEGLTSYSLKSDDLLQQVEGDLKKRIFELVSFLEKGGLLVYFLSRPFMVQGPTAAMDNYYWLESLAPDTPAETNVRHMSAVSHGRIVEPTDQADKSEFGAYFKQPGLEWSTIIRTDFLTEGYIVLATAGPRKCIAAHLIAGDNGGRIVFLPAPYSPDFDRVLMDAINEWGEKKAAGVAIGMASGEYEPHREVADADDDEEDDEDLEQSQPEPVAVGAAPPTMFSGIEPETDRASDHGAPPPSVPNSRLNPSKSGTNLPPVPKFSPSTSRSMPGIPLVDDAEPRKTKMTAHEILESVTNQAQKAADGDGEQPANTFNERTTGDIHAAFNQINAPLPQTPDESDDSMPDAADLLAELQSMSAPNEAPRAVSKGGAGSSEPAAPPAEDSPKPSRNLLAELESMGVHEPPAIPDGPQEVKMKIDTPKNKDKSFFESLSQSAATAKPATPPEPVAEEPTPEPATVPETPEYKFGTDYAMKESEAAETTAAATEAAEPPSAKTEAAEDEEEEMDEAESVDETAESADSNHRQTSDTNGDTRPEAKDLIKKMEETMIKTATPEWCTAFSFSDLDDLRQERDTLLDSIRQTQSKIAAIENKLSLLDGLKNALLACDGEDLRNACSRVFKRIGWTSKPSNEEPSELMLSGSEKVEVIARVVRSSAQAPRNDIASLAQSVLTFWGETEIEPKGLLVASTWANRPPAERNEPDFTDAMAEFAQKKSLCLMTTLQLLCIYRDIELGKLQPDEIRRRISDTNGKLSGFNLETPVRA